MRVRAQELLINAGTASQYGSLNMAQVTDQLFLHFRIEASAATLDATIGMGVGGDPEDWPDAAAPGLLYDKVEALTALPAGITYAGSGPALWTITTPAAGVHKFSARIINPPSILVAVYTYTTGGGAVQVKVKAVY